MSCVSFQAVGCPAALVECPVASAVCPVALAAAQEPAEAAADHRARARGQAQDSTTSIEPSAFLFVVFM